MRLVHGVPLAQVHKVRDAAALYDRLVSMVVKLAEHGLIHSDFNEFNIMLDIETETPVMIDFPQVESEHSSAVAENIPLQHRWFPHRMQMPPTISLATCSVCATFAASDSTSTRKSGRRSKGSCELFA